MQQQQQGKDNSAIRRAVVSDVLNIVRLLKSHWSETQEIQSLRVNERKATQFVLETIDDACVLVADLGGRLVGTLAVQRIQPAWSDDWFFGLAWFYVVPASRTRGTVERLLVEAETFMDHSRRSAHFDVREALPMNLDRMFASRPGYRHVGGNYIRLPDVTDDHEAETISALTA